MKAPTVSPDDRERAGVLLTALAEFEFIERESKKDNPAKNYDRRGMLLAFEDICESGSSSNGHIEIDVVTGRKLLPILRKLIVAELAAIGVNT